MSESPHQGPVTLARAPRRAPARARAPLFSLRSGRRPPTSAHVGPESLPAGSDLRWYHRHVGAAAIAASSDAFEDGGNAYPPPEFLYMKTGIVKWFNATKGYGFLPPEDGGRQWFVPIRALASAGLHTPPAGDRAEFALEP